MAFRLWDVVLGCKLQTLNLFSIWDLGPKRLPASSSVHLDMKGGSRNQAMVREPGCSPEGTSPVPLSPDPTPSQDTALSLPEPPYAQGEIPALVPQSFSV